MARKKPPGASTSRSKIGGELDEADDAQLIGLAVAGGVGRHVGEDAVGAAAEPFAQARRRLGVVEIHLPELDAVDRVHLQKVDGDHPAPALARSDARRRDLAPAAGRGAEIDDALAGLEELIFLVDLDELVGRARAIAFAPRLGDIRVVELAFEPAGSRRA